MQAGPGAPFEVIEAKLAFHLLLVALDAPPELGKPHKGAPPRGHGEGRAGRPDDQAALHAEMIRQAQGRQGVAKRGDIADYRPPAFRRHALRRSRSDCRVKTDATEQYYTYPLQVWRRGQWSAAVRLLRCT